MQTKICSICKETYPLTNEYFYKYINNKDGFKNICKKCIKTTAERHKNDIKKEYKICIVCKKEYPAISEYFSRYKASKDGLNSICNICNRKKVNEYKINNSEKIKQSQHKYYENNKDIIIDKSKKWVENNQERFKTRMKKYHEINMERDNNRTKKWNEENPEYNSKYLREYYKKQIENDPEYNSKCYEKNRERIIKSQMKIHNKKYYTDYSYKMNHTLATVIRQSLKGNKNGKHWESLVNYTLEQLTQHLENQFQIGMTWKNHGRRGWHIDHIIPKSLFKFNSPDDLEFKQCWALDNLQPLWEQDNLKKGNKLDYEKKVIRYDNPKGQTEKI